MKFLNDIDSAAMLKQDPSNRLVTDTQIEKWNLSEKEVAFSKGELFSWAKYEKNEITSFSGDVSMSETSYGPGMELTWPGLNSIDMMENLQNYTISIELSPGVLTSYTYSTPPEGGWASSDIGDISLFFPTGGGDKIYFYPDYTYPAPAFVKVESVVIGSFLENVFSANVSDFSEDDSFYLYERRIPVRANLEEWDELSPSYVDGKTHYDHTVNIAEFIHDSSTPLLKTFLNVPLKEGLITFEIDGVKQNRSFYTEGQDYLRSSAGVGDSSVDLRYNKKSRVVEISSEAMSPGSSLSVKIYQKQFKTLDEKFIPNTPSDWDEIDGDKKSFINNRPFGKEISYIGSEMVGLFAGEPRAVFDLPGLVAGQPLAFGTDLSTIEIELFLTEDGIYGQSPVTGGWVYLNSEPDLGPDKYSLTIEKRFGAVVFDTFIEEFRKGSWVSSFEIVLSKLPAEYLPEEAITTINGKTGVITKADIVALGIPAQDTIVDIAPVMDSLESLSMAPYLDTTVLSRYSYTSKTNFVTDSQFTPEVDGNSIVLTTPFTFSPTAKYCLTYNYNYDLAPPIQVRVDELNGSGEYIIKVPFLGFRDGMDIIIKPPFTMMTEFWDSGQDLSLYQNITFTAYEGFKFEANETPQYNEWGDEINYNPDTFEQGPSTLIFRHKTLKRIEMDMANKLESKRSVVENFTYHTSVVTNSYDAYVVDEHMIVNPTEIANIVLPKFDFTSEMGFTKTKQTQVTINQGDPVYAVNFKVQDEMTQDYYWLTPEPTFGIIDKTTIINCMTSDNGKTWNLWDVTGIPDISKLMPKNGGRLGPYSEEFSYSSNHLNLNYATVGRYTIPTGGANIDVINPTGMLSGVAYSFTFIVEMNALPYSVTFGAKLKWQEGVIPPMKVSKVYIINGMTYDGGVNWYCTWGEF